jgi:hypothetical protein
MTASPSARAASVHSRPAPPRVAANAVPKAASDARFRTNLDAMRRGFAVAGRRRVAPLLAAEMFCGWLRTEGWCGYHSHTDMRLFYAWHCGLAGVEELPHEIVLAKLAELPGVVNERRRIPATAEFARIRRQVVADGNTCGRGTVWRIATHEEMAAERRAATPPARTRKAA